MVIEHLYKRYNDLVIFDDFSLEIAEGGVTCILGPSGAGKSTLLNILAGLTSFKGDVPSLVCSYIFQQPRLVPNLTVRGNLSLVCRDKERVSDMLARVGLSDKEGSYPVALSGGQAQRVAIARAFLFDSRVVLMDEPFSSLDLKLKTHIMNVFREVRSGDGRTAVFVTHDVDEAVYLSDRIIVLDGGKIIFDSPNAPADFYGQNTPLREKLFRVLSSQTGGGL